MRRIRLVSKSAIAEFANVVYANRDSIYRVWLIAPWIGIYTDGSVDPLQLFVDALRPKTGCMVNVITRRPKPNADWHSAALDLLKGNVQTTLFFCDILHTKLYIVESDGMISAMMGSPNLTAGGNKANLELALELRTTSTGRTDEISTAVYDLLEYANDLLREESVRLAD